jgi:VanZ family protein
LTADVRFSTRLLGGLALGAMAFIVYGSLVPFEFHARDSDDAIAAFRWAMTHRWWFESRSDAIANVMLGVPLGFALLGFLRCERRGWAGDILAGVMVLPFSLLLAASVEFAQLYLPERTTSGSDVLCQGFGAVVGMAVWTITGRWLVRQAESIWSGTDAAGRLLIAYLVLLALIQLLPLDLSASVRDLYRKLRDDVVYVPFSGIDATNASERTARLIQVCGLFVPIGLLARRAGMRFVLVWGVGIAVAMEALQLLVKSRVPNATDAVVGMVGIGAGWWIGWRPPLASFAIWMAALGFVSWQPFAWAANPPLPFDWIPGLPLERGHPLFTLEEMLTKIILFGLGGWLLSREPVNRNPVSALETGFLVSDKRNPVSKAETGFRPAGLRPTALRAILIGLAISGIFEAGQTVFDSHTPCITDVLLGGFGMALGRFAALRSLGSGTRSAQERE